MDIPTEAIVGFTAVSAGGGAVLLVLGKALLAKVGVKFADKVLTPPAPEHVARVAKLDAANIHKRTDEALRGGEATCVALVKELSAEAAREECASCTALRAGLTASQDARINDLRELLPALAKSSSSMDSASGEMREVVVAIRELCALQQRGA